MKRLSLSAIIFTSMCCAPASEKAISPTEMLSGKREALWDNVTKFRIRFEIGSVVPQPTHYPDGTKHDVPQLVPAENVPDGFTVPISRELEATFKRIGITDLEKHFTGAVIEMEGIVSQVGLDLIGQETIWTHHITLRSLDQIHALTFPPHNGSKTRSKPSPRTFAKLEEFLSWADTHLKSGNLDALLAAQVDRRDGDETLRHYLEYLRDTLGTRTLAAVFAGREFPPAHDRFKLGGHDKELGHCHIDFVRKGGQLATRYGLAVPITQERQSS